MRTRELEDRKPWVRPLLRSENVQETLTRPACNFKPPGQGGDNPGHGGQPKLPGQGHGPAFS